MRCILLPLLFMGAASVLLYDPVLFELEVQVVNPQWTGKISIHKGDIGLALAVDESTPPRTVVLFKRKEFLATLEIQIGIPKIDPGTTFTILGGSCTNQVFIDDDRKTPPQIERFPLLEIRVEMNAYIIPDDKLTPEERDQSLCSYKDTTVLINKEFTVVTKYPISIQQLILAHKIPEGSLGLAEYVYLSYAHGEQFTSDAAK